VPIHPANRTGMVFRAERKRAMQEIKPVWEAGMTYKYIPLSQIIVLSIYLPSRLLYPKRWKWCNGTQQRTKKLFVPTGTTDGPNYIVTLFPITPLFTFVSICSILS